MVWRTGVFLHGWKKESAYEEYKKKDPKVYTDD